MNTKIFFQTKSMINLHSNCGSHYVEKGKIKSNRNAFDRYLKELELIEKSCRNNSQRFGQRDIYKKLSAGIFKL
jgi:hypothetical protein